MAEAQLESTTPVWVHELETRIQFKKQKLGHEIGAGAKCYTCKDACPGLELHFWRKKCKNCRCGKEDHDVPEDDDIRYQILFKDKENSSKFLAAKAVLEITVKNRVPRNVVVKMYGDRDMITKPMMFDWVPSEASPALAAAYMNELPTNKMPISGSVGAKYRKIQLKKQIPLHDILNEENESFSSNEKSEYDKYLQKLREDAGIGKILRIKQKQFQESSLPCDVQTVQTTGFMKPIEPANDLSKGIKNINIQHTGFDGSQVCAPGVCPFRPMVGSYVEQSPRSAMRTLPRTIPGSILRLPSAFIPKCDLKTSNDTPLNNNSELSSYSIDSDSSFNDNLDSDLSMTGIHPLEDSPGNEEDGSIKHLELSQPLSTPGTSTPMDMAEHVMTPSKYAQRQTLWDNPSPKKETTGNGDKNYSSDVENANCAGEPSKSEDQTEIHFVGEKLVCGSCQKPIEYNSIAVFVEKNGQKMAWHPNCFVCKECEELLVDLMYFYHKGSVYCARHYTEKLKIHRCTACDELIFVKEYTLAEGKYFHLHHFCCADCDLELADNKYVLNNLNDNLPTCLTCFENLYAKKCNTCGAAVAAGQQGVWYNDQNWHALPECFKCANKECAKSLVNQKFMMVNNLPFCSKECHFATLM